MFRHEFRFSTMHIDDELFRAIEETVRCSFEKSLAIFDEMFEKLKAVTK